MSKSRKLTELGLQRVKPPTSGRLELADALLPGLSCRVTPDGTRTFALRYRVDAWQRRLTLGRWPILGLADARQAAREALALVQQGTDPATARTEARRARERDSVASVIDEYVDRHLKRNTRRWRAAEQMLRRELRPWAGRPIESFGRRDVLDLVDGIVDRGSPVSANRTLALLKRFLGWAVERGIIEVNPAAGLRPPHREKPRDRTLSNDELVAVWNACATVGWPIGPFTRLLLTLGCRRGELASACWNHVDLVAAVWRQPAELNKGRRGCELPLSGLAVDILRELPRFEAPLLFPTLRAGGPPRPISGFTRYRARLIRTSGVADFTYHDCRRTFASGLARLGTPPHLLSRLLNHSPGSVEGIAGQVYNRHNYSAEQRQAVEAWGREVARIVAGAEPKLVALRA